MIINRRSFMVAGASAAAIPALAQSGHDGHGTSPTILNVTPGRDAPMPTPRHGLGAALIGDFIHLAGGGPVMGGGVQSAVHEAFTLG
ncbi:MAG TPA: hypothetical protein VNK52_05735 [Hyphomicrobiaceae bacterium]|nr:hypothetical protein [Hyphomicrobiaceae bacterium]